MANIPVTVEVSGISKHYPGVQALDSVDFDIRPGEVHALVGENGAGKSTLMKVLGGYVRPDQGTIRFRGEEVFFDSPLRARQKGILLVHQEISLVPELSVAENLFLGNLPSLPGGRLDRRSLLKRSQAVLAEFGYEMDLNQPVGELSIARQQMIEIAKAATFDVSVVVFDEPTASLTDREASTLFEVIERLKKRGVAIVYISHRMKEIFDLSDRITVLRDGRVRGTIDTATATEDQVTQLMIGRSLLDQYFKAAPSTVGKTVLEVRSLASPGHFDDVSFSVREGEVLGLYGLVGAGRSELAETIFGMREKSAGSIHWLGREVTVRDSSDAIRLGMGMVPEDRKRQGLVLQMGARENVALASLRQLSSHGFMSAKRERQTFASFVQRLSISVARPSQPVVRLSGGNQQKVVIAKWLNVGPKLLILDEPTRGIDVGSKAEVHRLIAELAASGIAIIVVSSEMPEILGVSHRILTMYHGRMTGSFEGDQMTEERLIAAVTGQVETAAA